MLACTHTYTYLHSICLLGIPTAAATTTASISLIEKGGINSTMAANDQLQNVSIFNLVKVKQSL
jgi:hypothetical protein